MPADDFARQLALERYHAAAHAVQTGVRFAMEAGLSKETDPKHLRTGVNVAMCDHSSLVKLLMRKGIINELEYLQAIADGLEEEKKRYEKELSDAFGKQVTLA